MTSKAINEHQVHAFLPGLFGQDLHAMRVLSLSLATLGVIHAASLSVYAIGQALEMARGKKGKHGVKQVDRMLSNPALKVWHLFQFWVPYVVAERTEVVIALDWTDYDDDDQTTLVASLLTKHGRPTPLVWLTVRKSTLKGLRNDAEDSVILRLRELIPSPVKVTLLADRGFADQKMYTLLEQVGFAYVVRFRKIITVTSEQGEKRCAEEWVPKAGQLRVLTRPTGQAVTGERHGVCPDDLAGRSGRESRNGALSQGQHGQDAHLFALAPRLYVLPVLADDARGSIMTPHGALRTARLRATHLP